MSILDELGADQAPSEDEIRAAQQVLARAYAISSSHEERLEYVQEAIWYADDLRIILDEGKQANPEFRPLQELAETLYGALRELEATLNPGGIREEA